MIRIDLLPAKDGDSLLVTYGDAERTRRLLIDGGRASSYPLIKPVLAAITEPLDLLVVTHVDQDHILGVLAMFKDPDRAQFRDVWFNGFDHLVDAELETFGARDGELFTTALLNQSAPWNKAFRGRSVEVGRPFDPFDDEAQLRILAPDRALLEQLIPVWEKECADHGLIPGRDPKEPPPGFEGFGAVDIEALALTPFDRDTSRTNITSIAFLLEYDGIRTAFTGDGDDARLVASFRELADAQGGGRVRVDALKVAHHGSDGNISRELLELIDCPRYLISTNGARHGHPDDVAMARILKFGGARKEIVFNYRDRAALWDNDDWKATYGYTVVAPAAADPDGFMTVTL